MEEDGKEEQPRHIISKTAEEISCIRTAMKGDGVLRKLSEAQLNALINEFDELKVRVSTMKIYKRTACGDPSKMECFEAGRAP